MRSAIAAVWVVAAAALVLPGPSGASVLAPWGADLKSATPNYDTANGDYTPYSQTNFSSNPTPGADHAISPQYHSGDDLAVWNTASGATAPAGGQVLYVKVKGCAWKDPSAPTDANGNQYSDGYPVNKVNFQTLARRSDGSYAADGPTAAGFAMPFCSDSRDPSDPSAAVNTSTITTFQPIHLCIHAGDTVDFYDIGGYIPQSGSYPNGVPFLVISGDGEAPGLTMNSYSHAQTAQSGSTADYSSSSSDFGIEPSEQLMLQVIEGTGDDAYGLCPGGKANEPSATSNKITCVYDAHPEPGFTDCGANKKPHHKHRKHRRHRRHKRH